VPDRPALLLDSLLTQILEETPHDVVLVFDEFQAIATVKNGPQISASLRAALTQADKRIGAVFSGSSDVQLLDMFSRASTPLYGFARTEGAVASEPVVAVLEASDGAADGRRKIAAAVERRRQEDDSAQIPMIAAFTTAQLDLALGRSNVVHAALLAGPASNGFLARCQSLERFRTIAPGGRGTG